jgi:hypothetical protein
VHSPVINCFPWPFPTLPAPDGSGFRPLGLTVPPAWPLPLFWLPPPLFWSPPPLFWLPPPLLF